MPGWNAVKKGAVPDSQSYVVLGLGFSGGCLTALDESLGTKESGTMLSELANVVMSRSSSRLPACGDPGGDRPSVTGLSSGS